MKFKATVGRNISTAQRVLDDLKERGGSTRSVGSGKNPEFGYMVGIGLEEVFHERLGITDVELYIGRHVSELIHKEHYLGAWEHDGKVYLDVARRFVYSDNALRNAKKNGEIAIWDVVQEKEIFV